MSIFEYDEEKHMKSEREEWREIGREEGLAIGHEEGLKIGLDNLSLLLKSLMDTGKTEELQRAFLREHTENNCIGNTSQKANKYIVSLK